MKELLKELLVYIEEMDVGVDAEWGAGRKWDKLKVEGGATRDGLPLYKRIEKELNDNGVSQSEEARR